MTFATRDLFDNAERQRTASEVPSSATAQDLVARGELLMRKRNPSELREARKLYDEAIRREPSLTAAWAGRVTVLFVQFLTDYTADRGRLLAEIDRDSLRAIALDDHDPIAWHARSLALTAQLRFDSAFEANDRSRALDPTRFFLQRGYLYLLTGRAAEALKVNESRQSMLGIDPSFLTLACTAHLYLGNYEQAIADCERAVSGDDSSFPYLHLTAAYAQVGDMAKAATAKAELMRRIPDFTIARFVARTSSNNPTWVRQTETQLIPGLRKAGVPE